MGIKKASKVNQEMAQEIGIGKTGAVYKPVFQEILIVKPNEHRYKKRTETRGQVYLPRGNTFL